MRIITNKIKLSFLIPNIVYVLLLGLIVRLILSGFGTLRLDHGTFVAWSNILVRDGFHNFYNSWSDYFPGYLYILRLLGGINLREILPTVLLYKIPAILSDLATGFLIYKILLKSKGEKWGLIGSALYIFNPAVLANSALWGQVDSLTAFTSILAIYLLPINFFLSAISLAAGTLIKPQTAFVLPVVIFFILREKWNFKKIFIYILLGISVFILGFYPFWNFGTLPGFIISRINTSLIQYPYASVNAFNFWGIIGFWKPDNIYLQMAGYAVVLVSTTFLSLKLWKNKRAPYLLASFIFAATFAFFTRMHERHLLPVFAPLIIIAIENPIFLIPYLGFSLTYVANLYYSYKWITNDFTEVFPEVILKFFSVLNVSFAVFIFYSIVKNLNLSWKKVESLIEKIKGKERGQEFELSKIKLSEKSAKIILVGILSFAFITRIYSLGSPPKEYFDEVYHAFTAKVILHNDPKAWEWWNTPPEGFAYEWTHPPLAKLGMFLGMKIFGENSFGYRVPEALLGLGAVFLVYLLAKEILQDEMAALLSAAVFSLDGLPLVMSRIAMNDSYILFFALLSIFLFMRQKNFLSALAFGLALSSKWSAIWAIPILGVLWLKRKNKFEPSILWFLLLPFTIYLLTYLPMFLTGHSLDIWWGMQKQMWWYHTGLRATHPYTSPWWSWPFLIRPIYLYTSDETLGMVARIYAMGNPLVFWFGTASVALSLIYGYLERNKKLGFIAFCYLIFFVPWAASPRIMFLYHYLPSIPFMAIAIGYILRRNPKLIPYFLVPSFLIFIYFYPHWAGLQVPLWLDKSYYWISSWR